MSRPPRRASIAGIGTPCSSPRGGTLGIGAGGRGARPPRYGPPMRGRGGGPCAPRSRRAHARARGGRGRGGPRRARPPSDVAAADLGVPVQETRLECVGQVVGRFGQAASPARVGRGRVARLALLDRRDDEAGLGALGDGDWPAGGRGEPVADALLEVGGGKGVSRSSLALSIVDGSPPRSEGVSFGARQVHPAQTARERGVDAPRFGPALRAARHWARPRGRG